MSIAYFYPYRGVKIKSALSKAAGAGKIHNTL